MSDTVDNFRCHAPEICAIPAIDLPELTRLTLPGGAQLCCIGGGTTQVVEINVVREGGLSEVSDLGARSLLNPMRREGAESISAEEFNALLEFHGANFNNSISSHHSSTRLVTLASKLPALLNAFADITLHPSFEPARFNVIREREAQRQRLNQLKVKWLASDLADRHAMGAGHPLITDVTPDDILSVTLDRVRQSHSQFEKAPLTIYVAGAVTDDLMRRIADAFSEIEISDTSNLNVCKFSPTRPGTAHIERSDSMQCAVAMTLPAIPRNHPDYVDLHIAVTALGGYFGSRLMTQIRERRGLTYGITAGLLGYIDGAYVKIEAEAEANSASLIIDAVANELQRLAIYPPTGSELQRLRQSQTATLMAMLDNPFTVSASYITSQKAGFPTDYFAAKREALATLTPGRIADVASKYLRPELLDAVVAGPKL